MMQARENIERARLARQIGAWLCSTSRPSGRLAVAGWGGLCSASRPSGRLAVAGRGVVFSEPSVWTALGCQLGVGCVQRAVRLDGSRLPVGGLCSASRPSGRLSVASWGWVVFNDPSVWTARGCRCLTASALRRVLVNEPKVAQLTACCSGRPDGWAICVVQNLVCVQPWVGLARRC